MTFDIKIKAYRKTLGMTQRAFSKYIGFSLRSINYWESGRILPDAILQRTLERALDEAVVNFKLKGVVQPFPDKNTMNERYGGVGRMARFRLASPGSGTESEDEGDE